MNDNFWTYIFIVLIGLAGGLAFFGVAAFLVFIVERVFFGAKRLRRTVFKKQGANEAWVAEEEHEREVEDEAAIHEEELTHPDTLNTLLATGGIDTVPAPRAYVPAPRAAAATPAPAPVMVLDEPEPVLAAPSMTLQAEEPSEPETVAPIATEPVTAEPVATRAQSKRRFPGKRATSAPQAPAEDLTVADEAPTVVEVPVAADDALAAPEPQEEPNVELVDPLAELRARLARRG